ncbi:Histone-lysine N-methyltransferase NSD3 [Allomyces arbusculus]|nr:Histone-lysine N-methyltransferase NSD3 [Allomyces arbusculus]
MAAPVRASCNFPIGRVEEAAAKTFTMIGESFATQSDEWEVRKRITTRHGTCGDTASCGATCVNRALNIECGKHTCGIVGDCGNRAVTYANPPVYVASTPDMGYGLFASCRIDRGTCIGEYVGQLVLSCSGRYSMRLCNGVCIDAVTHGNLTRFINHSSDPNCVAARINIDNREAIAIWALRDIGASEQLFLDYHARDMQVHGVLE